MGSCSYCWRQGVVEMRDGTIFCARCLPNLCPDPPPKKLEQQTPPEQADKGSEVGR